MGMLSGILKKVRGVLKSGKSGKDEIADILQEAFAQNFLFINGEKTNVSLSRVQFEEFEKQLAGIQSGFLYAGLSGSERPRFILLYPADCIKKLLQVIKEKHASAAEGDVAAVMKAMDWCKGNIDRLFQHEENSTDTIDPVDFLILKKSYASADKEGLLWNVSGYTILSITAGQVVFYLFVNEDTTNILRLNIDNKSYRKAAWELVRTVYSPDASAPEKPAAGATLRLEKPKEFIAGNSLIPQTTVFDRFRVKSVFKHITAGKAAPVKDGLWIQIFLTSGGSEAGINYLIPGVSKKDFTERFGDPNVFFKYLLNDVISFLKTNCPALAVSSVKLNVDVKPDAAALANCIFLSGELLVNYSRMGIAVYVQRAYFGLMYPHALKPWEYKLPVKSAREYLSPVLSLNMAFFNKNVSSFMKRYRSGLAYLPAATTCIPVYELMDLMDNYDLRILLQNLLLPKYSTGIARLFNIGILSKKTAEGTEKPLVRVLQVAYDKERITSMIPPVIAEEIDRKGQYIIAEEFDSFNKEVLKEITKAMARDQ
jgi:hypothetical protein